MRGSIRIATFITPTASSNTYVPQRVPLSTTPNAGLYVYWQDTALAPIGSGNKTIQAGELHQQTHEANATGTHCRTPQGYPEPQTRQESETWNAVKKGHDRGTLVETFVSILQHGPAWPVSGISRFSIRATG